MKKRVQNENATRLIFLVHGIIRDLLARAILSIQAIQEEIVENLHDDRFCGPHHQNGCDMTRNIPQPIWCIGPQKGTHILPVPSERCGWHFLRCVSSFPLLFFFCFVIHMRDGVSRASSPHSPPFDFLTIPNVLFDHTRVENGHNFYHQSWLW